MEDFNDNNLMDSVIILIIKIRVVYFSFCKVKNY